jgi:hypothetical protein
MDCSFNGVNFMIFGLFKKISISKPLIKSSENLIIYNTIVFKRTVLEFMKPFIGIIYV